MSARIRVTADAGEFAASVDRFLAAELERHILASVLRSVLLGRYEGARFAIITDPSDEPIAAAMRTPPHNLLCTRLPDPGPAPGSLRHAEAGERTLLAGWWREFYAEVDPLHHDDAERAAAARYEDRGLYVWDHAGALVSLIAVRRPAGGVATIGPVYTPSGLRRRGYAGSGVAAASRLLLAAGADVCMLFTDLANPTSNKIYAEVGYRRFADWEDRHFEPPAAIDG